MQELACVRLSSRSSRVARHPWDVARTDKGSSRGTDREDP
jgi:hypothetical protein